MKDTQTQTNDSLPMQELLGLDKQLKSIRGSLKVEVAKKVQLEEHIKKEQLSKARENQRISWRVRRWHLRRHRQANQHSE